ncbi:MAG: XdhC family protein [Hyphomicrobiaceae bacterium]
MPDTKQSQAGPTTVAAAAAEWLARDGAVVLATVVETWGSAPVPVGGQMVVARDGTFAGSVSGGCVEGDVLVAAEDLYARGSGLDVLSVGVSDETAWGVGLPCGGRVGIMIEHVAADTQPARIVARVAEALAARRPVIVRTSLETGSKTIFEAAAIGADPNLAALLKSGSAKLMDEANGRVFYEARAPAARVVIIGATHIAQVLAAMALMTDLAVFIVDPRTAFATPERFAGIDLRTEWPEVALREIGLDAFTAIAVVAHVDHIDDEALKSAVKSDAFYIGALGSRRTHQRRLARLRDAGLSGSDVARIKCPIGLDIGAQTPAEIAIGVLAEIVLALRGAKRPEQAITAGHVYA